MVFDPEVWVEIILSVSSEKIGKGIKVENFKVDKCLGVGFLGRQTVKTLRSTKIVLVI